MRFLSALRRSRIGASGALLLSVVFHAGFIAVSSRLLLGTLLPPPPPVDVIDIGFEETEPPEGTPVATGTSGTSASPPHPVDPKRDPSGAPTREPRPDSPHPGRGGTHEASEEALHLSQTVDGLTMNTDPTLFTEASQVSRLNTGRKRRSRDDRRTTPTPMELTFVVSGSMGRLSRLVPARTDPAAGDRGAVPIPVGARAEVASAPSDGFERPSVESVAPGGEVKRALGIRDGSKREDFRRSAAVAFARPAMRQGQASISTNQKGPAEDTLDSEIEVSSAVQSLITASTAGGRLGAGPGGSQGPGDPGSGGLRGLGSRALPRGEGGDADFAATFGIDSYAARLTKKVYPLWEDAFPMWARAEGRGGIAVIGVKLAANGAIRELFVVRASGFPEFDRKVTHALEQASPYGPLPRRVRDGLTLHIAFDAQNPAVGRSGPGAGRR
jgi:TonB family protein